MGYRVLTPLNRASAGALKPQRAIDDTEMATVEMDKAMSVGMRQTSGFQTEPTGQHGALSLMAA